jgi:ribosomal protein S2
VHAGHSKSNSILESSWIIYSFRQKIALINLDKTVHAFKLALSLTASVVSMDQPF